MRSNGIYLSLGSNLGNPVGYLLKALIEIEKLEGVRVVKISSFYKTKPWGGVDQGDFYNIGVEVESNIPPLKLLGKFQSIEKRLDRVRDIKWGPRTIDIDIISYKALICKGDDLTLPHPRFKERAFVLLPLIEIVEDKKKLNRYLDVDVSEIERVDVRVGVSSCLLGENTTYKGGNNHYPIFERFENLNCISICPEVLGGLEVPRIPCEIKGDMVIGRDGSDKTKEFKIGSERALKIIKKSKVDIVFLKEKSPSCGVKYIYDGSFTKTKIKGMGVAGKLFSENNIELIGV